MRIIDQFEVLLFDVQQTIMFDVDRFGEGEDYYSTYCSLGGDKLDAGLLSKVITTCMDYILPRYEDPMYFDSFPSLEEALNNSNHGQHLSVDDVTRILKTFALHECGHVPDSHVDCIKEFAKSHRLGVVSNIWAGKETWIEEFSRKGVLECFEVLVFSSDYSSIKPSPVLFNKAVDALNVDRESCVFIGDSHFYDIAGAKGAGIKTILTTNNAPAPADLSPEPDYIVPDIPYLLKEI